MNAMHGLPLDLNLLRVFEAVEAHRNVTQAARSLHQSQSSVSHALNRLRAFCGDPLFVRTRGGMAPTPFAESLVAPVRDSLLALEERLQRPRGFDPMLSQRTFNIALTDIGEALYLPTLMQRFQRSAGAIGVVVHPVTSEPLRQDMEAGRIDLAIGHLPGLKTGFYQQVLYRDVYVCMVRRDHPRVGRRITLKQFLGESHLLVRPPGTGGTSAIEAALGRLGHRRRIALTVPHFHAAQRVLAATDLVGVLSQRYVALDRNAQVRTMPVPFDVAQIVVRQFWHERAHHEPGNRWLRGFIAHLFTSKRPRAPSPREGGRGSA
jgi:DNA-binding transcriptional LysR family regulator